jgi:hypothetical protein
VCPISDSIAGLIIVSSVVTFASWRSTQGDHIWLGLRLLSIALYLTRRALFTLVGDNPTHLFERRFKVVIDNHIISDGFADWLFFFGFA